MLSTYRIHRIDGTMAVAALTIIAVVVLVAIARWIAGTAWTQMLVDLLG
jgi:hypothetical protein